MTSVTSLPVAWNVAETEMGKDRRTAGTADRAGSAIVIDGSAVTVRLSGPTASALGAIVISAEGRMAVAAYPATAAISASTTTATIARVRLNASRRGGPTTGTEAALKAIRLVSGGVGRAGGIGGGAPSWGAMEFPKHDRTGKFVALASGVPGDVGALPIRANARVLGASLKAGESATYSLDPSRHAYLVSSHGELDVGGVALKSRDGAAITGEREIVVKALTDAEVVMVDAP